MHNKLNLNLRATVVRNVILFKCSFFKSFLKPKPLNIKSRSKELTIEDVDECCWHDQDSHKQVCYSQRAQEKVGGIVQLLLQGHCQYHQNIPTNGEEDDDQNDQSRPVLPFTHATSYQS